MGGPKPGPRAPAQGMKEHELGPGVLAVAVPVTGEAAGSPDLDPVGGAVDGAPKEPRVDEGFRQKQLVSEAGRPVAHQAARAQRKHPRAEVARATGENQEPRVVGDQVQPGRTARRSPSRSTGRAPRTSAPAPRTPPAPATALDGERHNAPPRPSPAPRRGSGAPAIKSRKRTSSCVATMSTATSERTTTASPPQRLPRGTHIRTRRGNPVFRATCCQAGIKLNAQIRPEALADCT